MKTIGRLKLNQFSKAELEQRQMNALRGGIGCICHCNCSCTCSCSNNGTKSDKDSDTYSYNHAHKGLYSADGSDKQMSSYIDIPINYPGKPIIA